jgi:hypothetical protein
MAFTYQELKGKTLAQLRDIAKGVQDERVQGHSQMNKDHLLPALCQALGIDVHEHHTVTGIDKAAIKSRIRELKQQRDRALDTHDHMQLRALRRQIHHLNHQLRSLDDRWKALEYRGVVAGHDQLGAAGEPADSILRLQVARRVERLRNRHALLEILVQVHVVRREHRGAIRKAHRHVLRRLGVPSTRIATNTGDDLLIVPLDELHTPVGIRAHERKNIVGIDAAVRVACVPGFPGVVLVLSPLDPDCRFGKQLYSAGMIPVRVADDDVGNLLGSDTRREHGVGWLAEVAHSPSFDEIAPIEP